ncbi:LacI family DNA-binding transcriptional regulator [Streptomyces sp. NPDC048845]|uniref:LacI family DNA-binding transcriptional regulator n=1 Tax=Streptomyces sp. NPDC048845 TaxID=3155390 RepID=UPI00343E3629
MKDVAKRAGVSEKTVSNVINDYQHVSDATRRVVQEAIDALGYRVNLAGRHLRRGRTGMIALVVPELDVAYFSELAKLIVTEAERRSYTVLVHQTGGRRDREIAALSGFDSDFADGIILSPLSLLPKDLRERDSRLPLVLLGERDASGVSDHVAIDNVAAAREATAHLIAGGRRRIAVLGGRTGDVAGAAELRTRGYREALADAGIPYDPRLVVPVHDFLWPPGASATEELLDLLDGGRPDALFCLNDQLALGAMRALHERGLRVPRDVAVAGFDDIAASRFSVPSLTTVAPDKDAIAVTALDLLLSRIEEAAKGGNAPAVERTPPHRLLVRESSAASGAG